MLCKHSSKQDVLQEHIAEMDTLLYIQKLTPLLRKEMDIALGLHRDAREHPDLDDEHFQLLSKTYHKVTKHWDEIHRDFNSYALMISDMNQLERLLAFKIVDDYMPGSTERFLACETVVSWSSRRADIIEEYNTVSVDSAGYEKAKSRYENEITNLCKEMMVDRRYIETKIFMAAKGQHQGTDTQRFIAQCDWQGLARVLFNDRKWVLRLSKKTDFMRRPVFTEVICKSLLQSIDKLQKRYFTQLSDSDNFFLTQQARKLSANNIPSTGSSDSSSSIGKSNQYSLERPSWRGRVIRICSPITDKLHVRRSKATVAKGIESNSVIQSEKAE